MREPQLDRCESLLAEYHGARHCVLTGRGASALWAAYGLADSARPRVLLPASLCLSPWCSAVIAGRQAIFADIRPENATISPIHVEALLRADPGIGAVVAVHLLGNPADMDALEAICSRHGVLLIEDAAQSLGGRDASGRLLGSRGDIGILSFGHTKILDLGGGGALLTNNADLARRARERAAELPLAPPPGLERMGRAYSRLFYAIWEAGEDVPEAQLLFDHFPDLFRPMYLRGATPSQAETIMTALPGLEVEVARRRRLARRYAEGLRGLPDVSVLHGEHGVPWRFSFLVLPQKRASLLAEIRGQGFDASSWYPPIPGWTRTGRAQHDGFPGAEAVGRSIVNLWLTESYEQRVAPLIEIIRRSLAA